LLILIAACAFPVRGQGPAVPLITKPIDEAEVVVLHGNVHPLAHARYDAGAVPDSFAAARLLLLLNRSAARETELRRFLHDVHTPGSASYHHWLTPVQFGERFGPADSDVQAAAGWLSSHGFSVQRVAKSKRLIEFSGTAGQLSGAFHTHIHQYNIAGESHYANADEISIPAALAPLVQGVSPLNNFRAQSCLKSAGPALYSPAAKKTTTLWTAPNQFPSANSNEYLVAPEDFATQYDLEPLYKAGVNGAGQTIGIINESNIDISLVAAYQQLFNLPSNPPQVVIDGDDPGTLEGPDTEAYLDVELSGAVAPGATVNLYISNGSDLQDPVSLAALRAIEDNQASVVSLSFDEWEAFLGEAGNQLWGGLWEQAAAQGQTVLVSAGDNGSEDAWPYLSALSVNGLASTPWNVAMGGTDFYYSDYASGGPSAATLWNATNDSNLGSLKAPLPEQVWNDGLGLNVVANGLEYNEFYAGGGGASSCSTQSSSTNACLSGYSKPSWQAGPGVPADGARDLPDVSLFASNGANLSAYPICAYEGECAVGAGGEAEVFLAGGTSASAPAMAGIMALVNQKYGRQGQADFTLYPLARQKPAAFHDITLGSNEVPCGPGTPDCAMSADGVYATTLYSAGPHYDLASGLGSVDASVLVNNWNDITFLPTTTTLNLSATRITHGTPVTVSTTVAPESGQGTPAGEVAILTDSSLPSSQGQGSITLSGGTGSETLNYFPGGTYQVTGQYGGDGVYGVSTSSPVTLSVSPENSNINFAITGEGGVAINPAANANTGYYGQPVFLSVQPTGVSAASGKSDGNATGSATFTLDSTSATLPLNVAGVASWTSPNLSVGTHTASATYSGDASLHASSASPITFSVAKGVPFIQEWPSVEVGNEPECPGRCLNAGSSLTVSAYVGPFYGQAVTGVSAPLGTLAPTGTATVCLGPWRFGVACFNPNYAHTATLVAPNGYNSQYSTVAVTFPNLATGFYYLTVSYNGDANWQSWGLLDLDPIYVNSPATPAATTTTLAVTPSIISGTQTANFSGTVTGPAGAKVAPTGTVTFFDSSFTSGALLYYPMVPAQSGASATFNVTGFSPAYFWSNGPNQITAVYSGDANYLPSTSNVVTLTVTQSGGDFMMTPQQPEITVQAGSTGNVEVNLTSLYNFSGIVKLACAPSSSNLSCGVNPPSPMLNGAVTATLTINASAQTAAFGSVAQPLLAGSRAALAHLPVPHGWLIWVLFLLAGLAAARRKRKRNWLLASCLLAALWLAVSCGGSVSMQAPASRSSSSPPAASAATYSVVLTGTAANGIVHNTKVIVVVQ
jgi:subtilase family serine protease